MAGLRRINKTEILQYNGTFLSLLGLACFPDQSTLRRFLKRIPTRAIRQLVALHDHLRAQLFPLPQPRTTLTFDLDSVVLTIYGKLQYARVGYNPHKRGRRSYHPLVCFEAHLQEFLSWFSVKWRVAVFGKLLCSAASRRGFSRHGEIYRSR